MEGRRAQVDEYRIEHQDVDMGRVIVELPNQLCKVTASGYIPQVLLHMIGVRDMQQIDQYQV